MDEKIVDFFMLDIVGHVSNPSYLGRQRLEGLRLKARPSKKLVRALLNQ
jgi:hypothetical protein